MVTGGSAAVEERARIERIAEEHGLDTVRVGGVDVDGIWRGKRVSMEDFLDRGWRDGVHLCNAVLGINVADELVPDLAYTGWESGYPDVHLVPDLATFAPVPWADRTASVICDFVEADGTPTVVSPRQVLRTMLMRSHERGFEARVGYELEFYLFRETWESAHEKGSRA